jgi:hypothetical protein
MAKIAVLLSPVERAQQLPMPAHRSSNGRFCRESLSVLFRLGKAALKGHGQNEMGIRHEHPGW